MGDFLFICIDPIIVSVTSLKNLTCNFGDLQPAQFKVIMVPIGSPLVVSYMNMTSIVFNMYRSQYSRYLMRKFCDLDLKRFNVIPGQRSWCQSVVHG